MVDPNYLWTNDTVFLDFEKFAKLCYRSIDIPSLFLCWSGWKSWMVRSGACFLCYKYRTFADTAGGLIGNCVNAFEFQSVLHFCFVLGVWWPVCYSKSVGFFGCFITNWCWVVKVFFGWKRICIGFSSFGCVCIRVGDSIIKRGWLGSHEPVYPLQIVVSVPSQGLDFQRHVKIFFSSMFNELRWEVIVRVVYIGELLTTTCFNFLLVIIIYNLDKNLIL